MASNAINCSFWFGRYTDSVVEFSQSILTTNSARRESLRRQVTTIDGFRGDFLERSDSRTAAFHPSSVSLRCFFWMYPEFLEAEGKILRTCSAILRSWYTPPGCVRARTPILFKVLFTPHVILLPFWKALDITTDCYDLLTKSTPAYTPCAIRHLLLNAGSIAFEQEINGDLENFFRIAKLLDDNISAKHLPDCQRWLTKIVQTKPERIENARLVAPLFSALYAGFS